MGRAQWKKLSFITGQNLKIADFICLGHPAKTDSFECQLLWVLSPMRTKEFVMLDHGTITACCQIQRPAATLWHCSRCNAIVMIRAVKVVDEPFCPACGEVPLAYCGSMSGIPGLSFGEA